MNIKIKKISDTEKIINGIRFKQHPEFHKFWISEEGTYLIGSDSLDIRNPTKCKNHRGYPTQAIVCLNSVKKDDKRVTVVRNMGRLVLETFMGSKPNGMEVDHIDSNPYNNKLDNLRWISHKENCKRARHPRFLNPEMQNKMREARDRTAQKKGFKDHMEYIRSLKTRSK